MIRFGEPHVHHPFCDSTNEEVKRLAAEGAPGGLVVTADEQSAGRGRQGRTWSAPAGKALLYSTLLRPLTLASEVLPLAVPLAVAEAAEALAEVSCELKWPNDVWIEGRKVAGILIEARAEREGGFAVIGVGLNLAIEPGEFPAELRDTATSLSQHVSEAPGAGAARDALSERLAVWLARPASEVVEAFTARDALAGRPVSWTQPPADEVIGNGTAAGISERGELRVALADGSVVLLSAGEVHLESKRLTGPSPG